VLDWITDSPFAPIVALCAGVAAACALAVHFTRLGMLGGVAAPAVFALAYDLTYQKIPPFPPVGAANKVFWVGVFAAVVALALEAIPSVPALAKAALAALLGVLWIGASQWERADLEFGLMSGAVVAGGALALWVCQLQNLRGGGASSLSMAAALAVLLAPAALFGGSSTGVGLCLGSAVGLAVLSLPYLAPGRRLPQAATLSIGAGLLGLVDAIALVSRKADFFALALVALAPLLGLWAVGLLPESLRRPWIVWFVSGLATLAPLPLIVALLFWRHESPL
jgi:hypothetical protein